MFRRSLGAALWTLVGLLAGFLGALSSLVGTGAGRALLARVTEGALRQAFTGTMEIGDVRGWLLTRHPDPVSQRWDPGRHRAVAPAGEAPRAGRLEPRDRERRH